jgi:ferredoxin-type protein NapH
MSANLHPYVEARETKGVVEAHRFGVLRRLAQASFLALFLAGPMAGVWIVKGNFASSRTLGVLPLTDPFVFAQTLAARHAPEATATIGAAIVLIAYALLGGRSFCAWACPLNPVTDLAAWLRRRLDLKPAAKLKPQWRNWIAVAALGVSAATGMVAWELVNPITALHRALVFGLFVGLVPVLAVFVFDLAVAKHGWCGHLCPVGACYGALGKIGLTRVTADRRERCDDCMDCFAVCPEPQVIRPALKKAGQESPLILASDCTTCGRCIDVCDKQVFKMTHRFDQRSE